MRIPRIDKISNTGLFHKFWQGHNYENVIEKNVDKRAYIDALAITYTDKISPYVDWYSYCLMSNHPHETGSVSKNTKNNLKKSIGVFGNWMRNAHSRFATGYNKRQGRRGSVACERPETKEISDEAGVLQVMFYGDANPVKAGIVKHPSNWKYSSYNFYAYGKKVPGCEAITPPAAYMALGRTPKLRRRKYRRLCDAYLRHEGLLKDISDGHENPDSYQEELANALAEMVVNDKLKDNAPEKDS